MRQQIEYIWGSDFSVHDLKIGMLPNLYFLFSDHFY